MNPELLHEARQLLARASVLSEVASSPPSLGRSSHSKPDGSRPKGSGWAVFDELGVAIQSCTSDRDLERFVATARLELRRWTNASPNGVVTETTREFRVRVLAEHSHRSIREAAALEHVPAATIQRVREWAKEQAA